MSSAQLDQIPNSGGFGMAGKNDIFEGKPLTAKQKIFMEHYFDCNGSPSCIAERAGWVDKNGDPERANVNTMHQTRRIQIEIARRTKQMSAKLMVEKEFTVDKRDRIELLWMIAQGGTERVLDNFGNMVFMNPAVSVSAIRTINDMLPGSLAPKEVEITHKQEDTRTEAEIKDNIAKLQQEYQSLVAIDGQTITIKESDIKESESLTRVTPEGRIIKHGKKVHVPARRELE